MLPTGMKSMTSRWLLAALSIDLARLPRRALLETGVLIRGLGDRKRDQHAVACRLFFDAMLNERREILVAAPSVAEMLRGKTKTPIPRVAGLTVVGFDRRAAHLLAEQLPEHVLVKQRSDTGSPLQYLKYDALIVACALRHAADAIVALDAGVMRLARVAGLENHEPEWYRAAQQELNFESEPTGDANASDRAPTSNANAPNAQATPLPTNEKTGAT